MNNAMDFLIMMAQSMVSQRFNIPQNISNPEDMVKHLVNSGQVSQEQVNQAIQKRNNPINPQFFKR